MAHSLFRLSEKLYNTPHLISEASLTRIMQVIEDRNNGSFELAIKEKDKKRKRDIAYNSDTGVGIVSVSGPLTYIEYEALCGEANASYQQIRDEFNMMVNQGAKTIVLDIDSPGGEAYQAFETAQYLRTKADEKGVRLVSYVDGLAASAAYALASVSHELIMNPMSEVGSIGVVVKLRNINKALKEMGIEETYVYAGKSKIPFNSEGDFSEEFLNDIQTKVDVLYEEFISHVANARGMEVEAVKNTEAKTFLASEAIELGLADKQMTLSEFSNYLADLTENGEKMPVGNLFKFNKEEETLDMTQLAELQASLEAVQAELVSSKQAHTALGDMLTEKEAALSAALEKVASLEAEKKQAKAESRKEKLSAVMAQEKVEAVASSLEGLSDEAFATVLSGFAAQAAVVEQSALMQEVGGQGAVVEHPAPNAQENLTAKLLKAQFEKGAK